MSENITGSELDTNEDQSPAVDTVEDKARARGWLPEEEYEGERQWVPANEYLFRGELMDTIHNKSKQVKAQGSRIEELEQTVKEQKEFYEKLAKAEIDKHRQELKKAKAEALSRDDHEAVVDIDEELSNLRLQTKQIEENKKSLKEQESSASAPTQLPIEIEEWLTDNPWANENSAKYDPALATAAKGLLSVEVSKYGNNGVATLNKIKRIMVNTYPESFGKDKVAARSVDNSYSGTGSSKTLTKKLNPQQTAVGKKLVRSGALESLEEYAKGLQKIGEI